MRMLLIIVPLVAFSLASFGQDPAENAVPKQAMDLAKILASNWQEELEFGVKKVLGDTPEGLAKEEVKRQQEAFQKAFRWTSVTAEVAAELASRYRPEELSELHAFFTSEVGKKFASDRTALRTEILAKVLRERQRLALVRQMASELEALRPKLKGKAREAVENALKAAPFDAKLLHGKWYANDTEENGNGYVGWLDLKSSGISHLIGVEINHGEKEYSRFEDHGAWFVKGRLLAVADFTSPDLPRFYLLNSVSAKQLDYWFVDEFEELDQWEKLLDSRTPVEIPEKPAGYTDPYED